METGLNLFFSFFQPRELEGNRRCEKIDRHVGRLPCVSFLLQSVCITPLRLYPFSPVLYGCGKRMGPMI